MNVRDVIRRVEKDGWFQVATRGSHRQYKHATKSGRVTIPGKLEMIRHLARGERLQTGWPRKGRAVTTKYLVIIERADGNFSAYVPDVPAA